MSPVVPVSWGELLDKIAILEIKAERLTDAGARANVEAERAALSSVELPPDADALLGSLAFYLRATNRKIWDLENVVRGNEAQKKFDNTFIEACRAIYQNNDERARIKRAINTALESELTEEKEYA